MKDEVYQYNNPSGFSHEGGDQWYPWYNPEPIEACIEKFPHLEFRKKVGDNWEYLNTSCYSPFYKKPCKRSPELGVA